MNEQQYREAEGVNYSLLKQFSISPDHAALSMSKEQKFSDTTLNSFRLGHCFEYAMYPGQSNKLAPIPESINRRTKKGKEEFSNFLQFCEENKKTQVSQSELFQLICMAENAKRQDYLFDDIESWMKRADKQGSIEKPIFWKKGKIEKKCLVDFMIKDECCGNIHVFDLKTMAGDSDKFRWRFKDGYWIQAVHYLEGVKSLYPDHEVYFNFVVGHKDPPYVCKIWEVSPKTIESLQENYESLVDRFYLWKESGCYTYGGLDHGIL